MCNFREVMGEHCPLPLVSTGLVRGMCRGKHSVRALQQVVSSCISFI